MTKQPIFNAPLIVILVLALVATIHVIRNFISPEMDWWVILSYAFIPARFEVGGTELPGGEAALYWTWLTHMFLHGDVMHLLFNSAWLLIMGTVIAMRFGPIRFVLFFLLTGMIGVATFLALNPGLAVPVIGASGAVSGLAGGVMRILFNAIDDGGIELLRLAPASVRAMTVFEALKDRRVLAVTLATLVLNAAAAFGFGVAQGSGGIAWEAHIGGYFAGLILFGLFDPIRNIPELDKSSLSYPLASDDNLPHSDRSPDPDKLN